MNRTILIAATLILPALAIGILAVGNSQKSNLHEGKLTDDCCNDQATANNLLAENDETRVVRTSADLLASNELYQCPMHPTVISNVPDVECSICGMKMEIMTKEQVSNLKKEHSQANMSAYGCEETVKSQNDCANCDH